ncbi:hypothetical protein A3840_14845 [Devosia elaeis]|uniref:Uncharacterized protein n=1 Tax=Devosia elaeis TaxID=1770058 RepID=A0A178HQU5_9HYPH|nr:hypothetical protein A3840_14845 [Devosia elaeis]
MSMTPSRRAIEAMTLGGMALDNRALVVRCYSCRRTRRFLAADLARVYGENQSPHTLFRRCSKCGDGLYVGFGFPQRGDTIRRPESVTKWQWRDEVWEPS